MTSKEAEKVVEIMLEADGGCPYCADHLIQRFVEVFPEYGNYALHTYREHFHIMKDESETCQGYKGTDLIKGDYKYNVEFVKKKMEG